MAPRPGQRHQLRHGFFRDLNLEAGLKILASSAPAAGVIVSTSLSVLYLPARCAVASETNPASRAADNIPTQLHHRRV